jgi:uroporphyrinogen-III synthase
MRALETLPDDARRPFQALPLFAVGRATARAATEAGFKDVSVADGDGHSLAGLLIAKSDQNPGASILYLTGTPRSPDFEAELRKEGRRLDVRECYRMVPTTHSDAAAIDKLTPMPEAILVYSSETARRLGELHDRTGEGLDWPRTRFLCLSEKIANALPTNFRARSLWPMEPREDLLLLLL